MPTSCCGRPSSSGLFLAALDGSDEWYRYHHLFAEALRHELRVRFPDASDAANGAAAAWFEEHGDAATALEHWLAAGRPDEALRLAVQVGFTLVDRGQAATLERIARRIPATVPGDDPARQLDYGLIHIVFEPETFLTSVGEAGQTIEQQANPDGDLRIRYLMVQAIADIIVGAWNDAVDRLGEAWPAVRPESRLPPTVSGLGWSWSGRPGGRNASRRPRRRSAPTSLTVAYRTNPACWSLRRPGRSAPRSVVASMRPTIGCSAVIANAEVHGSHGVFSIQEMLLAQAIIARERGDAGAALESIEQIRAVGVDSYYSLRAMAEIEAGLAHLDTGRLDAAAVAFDAARRVRPRGDLGARVTGHVDAAASRLCLFAGDLVGAGRAAARMPSGVWRDAACARVFLADGAAVEAEGLLRAVSPTTPRQQVVVGVLRALALVDRDPQAADDEIASAVQTAADHGLLNTVIASRPGRRRVDREGQLGGSGCVDGRRSPSLRRDHRVGGGTHQKPRRAAD